MVFRYSNAVRSLFVAVVAAGGLQQGSAALTESLCKPAGELNGLVLSTTAGYPDCRYVGNPFQADYQQVNAKAKFCWLTSEQVAATLTCDKAFPSERETRSFLLATCTDKDKDKDCSDPREWILHPHGLSDALLHSKNPYLAVIYAPEGIEARDESVVLRVEWNDQITLDEKRFKQYAIRGRAGPSATYRHRLSLYLGASYLYSEGDFGETFPEVRMLVETRPVDKYLFCRRATAAARKKEGCDDKLLWPNFRVYGDVGLTSAAAQDVKAGEAGALKGTRAFDGSMSLGILGFTFEVPSDPHDTRVFSVMPIARIGITSLPIEDAAEGGPEIETLPFSDFFGLRFENEDGHFAGAYFEFGFGQSNQFPLQKTNRLKAEAFVPFAEPGTIRLAARLQVDRPSPFGGRNSEKYVRDSSGQPVEEGRARQLIGQGNIRITLMFNVDARRLFDVIGATK